jgi:hypothetical protein
MPPIRTVSRCQTKQLKSSMKLGARHATLACRVASETRCQTKRRRRQLNAADCQASERDAAASVARCLHRLTKRHASARPSVPSDGRHPTRLDARQARPVPGQARPSRDTASEARDTASLGESSTKRGRSLRRDAGALVAQPPTLPVQSLPEPEMRNGRRDPSRRPIPNSRLGALCASAAIRSYSSLTAVRAASGARTGAGDG